VLKQSVKTWKNKDLDI